MKHLFVDDAIAPQEFDVLNIRRADVSLCDDPEFPAFETAICDGGLVAWSLSRPVVAQVLVGLDFIDHRPSGLAVVEFSEDIRRVAPLLALIGVMHGVWLLLDLPDAPIEIQCE